MLSYDRLNEYQANVLWNDQIVGFLEKLSPDYVLYLDHQYKHFPAAEVKMIKGYIESYCKQNRAREIRKIKAGIKYYENTILNKEHKILD